MPLLLICYYYLLFYSFSRLINVTDIGQDYDLDSLFYLLYGRSAAGIMILTLDL